MGTSITSHDEVERKYDVAAGLTLPALTDVTGVASLGQQETLDLEAVYFDTPGMDLHRHGMSLRRRTGGVDDGWHLKLPREEDRRTELQIPLGRAVRTVPARLLEPIRAVVRDRPLEAVATVLTHRVQQSVLDDTGGAVATLCDDTVEAESLRDPDRRLSWREVEVELVDGQPADLMNLLEVRLLQGGASPAVATSKVRRILGDVPAGPPDAGQRAGKGRRRRGRKATAAEVLLDHMADQVAAIHHHDRGVREGERRSVHQLRIAVRRLRAVLDTYEPLLARGSTDVLGEELRWLGQSLAPARDAEILRQRFDRIVAEQPAELVLGAVASRIDNDLARAHRAGLKRAREAMGGARYYRLLDALDDLVVSPQWLGDAGQRAVTVVPALLERDVRAVRKAVRRARDARGLDRDAALHTVRKKMKRLRYAAESARPALGSGAASLAKRAKTAQTALGEHQDSVVARAALRRWGIEAHLEGANAFTFGRLHGLEDERARVAEEAFWSAMAGLRPKDVRRSLGR